jgi:polyisoprenoid-binding protein YceI
MPRAPRHRSRTEPVGGALTTVLVVALVVVAGLGALYWFVWRSEADPPPEITNRGTVAGGTVDGRWEVAPLLGSWVQYRVKERLAGALESDATGRTTEVEGALTVAGSTVSDVRVEADLSTLESDKTRRDERLRTDGLQTDTFPTATFTLTEPIELGQAPAKGKTIRADATGDLTLHGVTRNVTIPLEGRWDGEAIEVVGRLPIEFADYDITPPNVAGVVTVADKGRMELQLVFLKP